MEYETANFLSDLFNGKPTRRPFPKAPPGAPEPAAVPRAGDARPALDDLDLAGEALGVPTAYDRDLHDAVLEPPLQHDQPERDADILAPFAWWVRRPDVTGRMGWEDPDLREEARWWGLSTFDALPEPPAPCPECGGLESWWDILGGWHCQGCEATALKRSRDLAARAAGLRAASQRKPAPQDCACCVPAGLPDALDLGANRPSTGHLRGFDGT